MCVINHRSMSAISRQSLDSSVLLTVSMSNKPRGFECTFVEAPPSVLQSECPLCRLVLREPHQVTCCGYSYCKACVEGLKANREPCPCCKKSSFQEFPNKGLQRALSGFTVSCSNQKEGCEWTGEYGKLENHLNCDPSFDRLLEGCSLSKVPCSFCFKVCTRSDMQTHRDERCPWRPFTCEYCGEYKSHYDDVVSKHYPSCQGRPVQCPNGCGRAVVSKEIEGHIQDACPMTMVTVCVRRKDLPSDYCLVDRQREESKGEQVSTLRQEYLEYRKRVASLTRIASFGPIDITVVNFASLLERNDVWSSRSFYSDIEGYRFVIGITPKGATDASGRVYVSIAAYLMRGEFDDKLRWPFRGRLTIQLLDQLGSDHVTYVLDFSCSQCVRSCKRVPRWRHVAQHGLRHLRFISHDQLRPKYLNGDLLHFQVSKIEPPHM